MVLPATCPSCGHFGRAPDSAAGKRITCPKCGSVFELAPIAVRSLRNPSALAVGGEEILERATQQVASEAILWMAGDDRAMARAIAAAQSTFLEFARQVELENFRTVPGFEEIAVKAFFADSTAVDYGENMFDKHGEHMFVSDISTDGKSLTGVLASEPDAVPGLSAGQEVAFPVSRLSDWFLVTGGKGVGGFTIDVLKKQLSPAQ